jgi:hypothetical protein
LLDYAVHRLSWMRFSGPGMPPVHSLACMTPFLR